MDINPNSYTFTGKGWHYGGIAKDIFKLLHFSYKNNIFVNNRAIDMIFFVAQRGLKITMSVKNVRVFRLTLK